MAQIEIDRLLDEVHGVGESTAVRILDALGIATYTTDADGIITYYNEAAVDLWGREPLIGKEIWCGSWRILYPDGSVMPHDECPMAIALKEDRAVRGTEAIAERPDGSRVWFTPYPTPLHDESGKLIGAVNALVDITRIKNAELELARSEARHRELVEGVGVAVYTTDAEGRITLFNEAAAELWGRRPELGVDRWCGSLRMLRPDGTHLPHEECPMALSLKEGKSFSGALAIVERPDGSRIWVEPHPTPLKDEAGIVTGAVNVFLDVTERVEAEQRLRESEQNFRRLFDSAAISLWEEDFSAVKVELDQLRASGIGVEDLRSFLRSNRDVTRRLINLIRIKDVNRHSVELFGAKSKAELLDSLPVLSGSESEDGFIEEFIALAEGQREVKGELPMQTLDGRRLQVLFSIAFPALGAPVDSVLVTVIDMTERRAAEEAVRDLNRELTLRLEELETIFKVAPIAIAVAHDPLANEITLNPAGERMLGVTPGTNASKSSPRGGALPFIVMKDGEEVAPESLPMQRAARNDEESADEEYEIRRSDGSVLSLLEYASPLHDDFGKARGSLGIFVDITERNESESAIRASEERFRTLTSMAPVGIFLTDATGDRLFSNERWQKYAGLSNEEATGKGWINALHPDDRDRVVNEWYAAVSQGQEFSSEYRFQTPLGEVTWLHGRATSLRNRDGVVEGYVGTVTDVTELKEAARLKDQFLGLISHELRTPLATIYGGSRLLADRFELIPEEDRKDLLTDLVSETLRLQRIIENLLLMTRLDAIGVETEPVSIPNIVIKSVAAFKERTPMRSVDLKVDAKVPPVLGNQTYVELVVDNLIANASKYSSPDTPIEVQVQCSDRVEVRVMDRGIGLAPEDQDKLFTPFYRSRSARDWASGVGVGLAVSKRTIEAQGGEIWARPREGGGSEFGFWLPTATESLTSET